MSIAASKLQQRRRDQERLLHETESFLHEHHNTKRIQDWETRTQQHQHQREVSQLTKKLIQEDEDKLRARQHELQSLYQTEMSKWKNTLEHSLDETQEQRIERIRHRAYALKEKREQERKEFVEKCYRRQWRDACDDLRALDSKETLDRLMQDRKLMIRTKTVSNDDTDSNQRMQLMQKRENDERRHQQQANLETKLALDQQLKWKRAQMTSLAAQIQYEEEEQLRQLSQLEQMARESEKIMIQRSKEEGEVMRKETMQRAREREERQRLEENHNSILLQHALELEKMKLQAEQAKKEEGKEAAAEYIHCLQEQQQQEEKEKQRIDNIRNEEFERIAKKNEEKEMSEAEERRQWVEDTNMSRQEQIRRKRREDEELRKKMVWEFGQTKEARHSHEESERRKCEQALADRMEVVMANRATIQIKAKEKEIEQQEKHIQNKQIQYAERMHQKKIEEETGNFYRPM